MCISFYKVIFILIDVEPIISNDTAEMKREKNSRKSWNNY